MSATLVLDKGEEIKVTAEVCCGGVSIWVADQGGSRFPIGIIRENGVLDLLPTRAGFPLATEGDHYIEVLWDGKDELPEGQSDIDLPDPDSLTTEQIQWLRQQDEDLCECYECAEDWYDKLHDQDSEYVFDRLKDLIKEHWAEYLEEQEDVPF